MQALVSILWQALLDQGHDLPRLEPALIGLDVELLVVVEFLLKEAAALIRHQPADGSQVMCRVCVTLLRQRVQEVALECTEEERVCLGLCAQLVER